MIFNILWPFRKRKEDKGTLRKETGKMTAGFGFRWRWQCRTKMDGDKWSVAYVLLEATRRKSNKLNHGN